jgi:hypothetical protein
MTQIGGVPSARKSGPAKSGVRADGSTRTSNSSSTSELNSSNPATRPVANSTAATPHFSEPIDAAIGRPSTLEVSRIRDRPTKA